MAPAPSTEREGAGLPPKKVRALTKKICVPICTNEALTTTKYFHLKNRNFNGWRRRFKNWYFFHYFSYYFFRFTWKKSFSFILHTLAKFPLLWRHNVYVGGGFDGSGGLWFVIPPISDIVLRALWFNTTDEGDPRVLPRKKEEKKQDQIWILILWHSSRGIFSTIIPLILA